MKTVVYAQSKRNRVLITDVWASGAIDGDVSNYRCVTLEYQVLYYFLGFKIKSKRSMNCNVRFMYQYHFKSMDEIVIEAFKAFDNLRNHKRKQRQNLIKFNKSL